MIISSGLSPATTSVIDAEILTETLDRLLLSSRPRFPNSLDSLFLVDEAMLDTTLPKSASMRTHFLSDILTSTITEELFKQRQALALWEEETETSQKAALEAIRSAKNTDSWQLVAWSWAYYRYVRPDLNISIPLFCSTVGITTRTLSRYRDWATRKLLSRLIEKEICARRRHHRRFLNTQLPTMTPLRLVGREELLNRTLGLICGENPPHIQVVGAAGVGKTAFVQAIVQRIIGKDLLDGLVWLQRPRTVDEIYQQLFRSLKVGLGYEAIREVVQYQRMVFVFDEVDTLYSDLAALETLANNLRPATIFVTTRAPLPLRNEMEFIVMPELDHRDAQLLIGSLLQRWHFPADDPPSSDDVDDIWRQTGGNPGLIQGAVFGTQMRQARNLC